jgi:predicted flap endonuclease-1-like 5' DNA nuclease
MAYITETSDPLGFRRDAARAMTLPLGMANPFWLLFGAAASAGMTWWWVNKLMRSGDMSAMAGDSASIYEMAEATASTAPVALRGGRQKKPKAPTAEADAAMFASPEMFENAESAGYPRVVLEPTVPQEARTADHASQIPAESSETADHAGYPVVAPGPAAEAAADDLTRLTGIGPRIAAALESHGVTRFAQLAAWTPEHLAAFDKTMKLKGRALHSDWIAQAARLSADA